MTFDRPIFFTLLLILPVLWYWARAKRGSSRISFALKSLVFTLLVAALAGPHAQLPVRHVAVALLADTSASMPRQSIEESQTYFQALDRAGTSSELHLITFAGDSVLRDVSRGLRNVTIPEDVNGASGMDTDLEGAIDLALGVLPREGARRVLLISDGNQTRGDALAAALRARAGGVSIFVVPSGGVSRLPFQLTGISAPESVFTGERFTVTLNLTSAQAISTGLSISSQGKQIAEKSVQLAPGVNSEALDARMSNSGVNTLDVTVDAGGIRQTLLSQAITVRKPRVLYIAGKDGPSDPLLKTLNEAQIDVQQATSFPLDAPESNWDSVILDDYPDQPLSPEEGAALTNYVSSGGGMIFVGGDRNARIAKEPATPLEKLLPVRGDPNPAPEQPTALVLVLDKSLSMEGAKISMVRQAARASVATLRPIDKVGLVAFDKEFRWVVPLAPVASVQGIDSAIDSIQASGGTRIYPAMEAAYESISAEQATRKHIILLTDGMSPPGDLPLLEQSAAANHITISTIGVGDDVDGKFLKEIADSTRGKSYLIEDPHRITEIVNDETKDLENTEIVEKPVRAVVVRSMELTEGVDFAHAPPLLGFIKTKARPGAETILRTSTGEPLLVRWQAGLGRVAAFLSDSRPRWAAGWISWRSYGTLWPQLVRDSSRHDPPIRTNMRFSADGAEATVTYDFAEQTDQPSSNLQRDSAPSAVVVTMPDRSSTRLPLHQTAHNRFEVTVAANQSGLYRLTGAVSSMGWPAVGFIHAPEELKARSINVPLLHEISQVTGGGINPTVSDLLDERGNFGRERQPIWAYFVVLALLVNFFELAWRKGIFEKFGSKLSLHGRQNTAPAHT